MYGRLATIYYGIGSFVLFTAFFVMQPSNVPEVASLQENIQHNFTIAFWQTVGDQPMFDDVLLVYESVSQFYAMSADSVIAMMQQPEVDQDLAYIYGSVFNQLMAIFENPSPPASPVVAGIQTEAHLAESFMSEPAVYNIIPTQASASPGAVSGIRQTEPVNLDVPWVTIKDNFTGQLYCLAVYNGEVNKYMGPCKYDYH